MTPILAVLRLHRNKAQFFTNNNIGRTVIYKYCFSRIQFTIFYHRVKISPFSFIFHHSTHIRKSLYYSVF